MSIRPSVIDRRGEQPCLPANALLAVCERLAEGGTVTLGARERAHEGQSPRGGHEEALASRSIGLGACHAHRLFVGPASTPWKARPGNARCALTRGRGRRGGT